MRGAVGDLLDAGPNLEGWLGGLSRGMLSAAEDPKPSQHTRDLYDSIPASAFVCSCTESGAMMIKAVTAEA